MFCGGLWRGLLFAHKAMFPPEAGHVNSVLPRPDCVAASRSYDAQSQRPFIATDVELIRKKQQMSAMPDDKEQGSLVCSVG